MYNKIMKVNNNNNKNRRETKVFCINEFACPLSLVLTQKLSLWNFLSVGVSLLLEVGATP